MQQYKTQYGTIFAVKEHNGAPAIMCRAEHSETWSLSSMIEPFTPGAWTAEGLQGQLDSWAATKGWQPVEEPASVEPPETADEDGEPEDGFPDWVRPMVEAFLQFDFVRELPAFTTAAFKNSESVRHHWGGSLANGLYDTGPKGIKFSVFRGPNSDQYREASYTWAGFVRRCRAAGLEPKPLRQDKEATPCNTEPTAPTGAAAATTDGSAAVSTAETTTTSESGAGANSCGTPAPAAQPSSEPPAELAPTAPASLPAFDYSGLDDQTVAVLHLAESEIREARQAYISRLSAAVAAAHEAVVANCENGAGGRFIKPEGTFFAWCASVGLKKDAAYRLLQINALFNRATAAEQAVLENASPSLLYAAAKPSAPAELVQAVKDGDITTHKQYQEALAEIRARDAKINDLLEMSEAADRRADKAEQAAKDTARERDTALRRAAEAEKQRDDARDALAAAKLRGDKLKAENDALKAHPIEAQVVDEEEIDRRAQARANELTAPLREELEALRNRHPADPEAAEQAIRDAYDSTIYTGRVIENAWHTLRPLLPRMDADRRELALNQIVKIISTIQGECIQCL